MKPATRRGWTSKSRPDKAAHAKPVLPAKPTDPMADGDGPLLRKDGRPYLFADMTQAKALLSGLGSIQATWRECCAVLQMSEATLSRLFRRWPECKDAYEDGKANGLTSLRRNQFDLSKKNATMAIFLGMNYLDQKDMRNVSGNVNHKVTALGALLKEIDDESRKRPLIEHEPLAPGAGMPVIAGPGADDA